MWRPPRHEADDFLSAWAREEWEPACYQLPSHRLQPLFMYGGVFFVSMASCHDDEEFEQGP
jgi:hypothetical protein